jgi:Putative zinc-finger
MTCRYAEWDAAYVLGSLSPAERAEYHEHLAECASCTRAVQELAGMPGLLAKVTSDVLTAPTLDEPVPATLLPSLVAEVRRRDWRRTWLTSAAVAAVAASVVGIGAVGIHATRSHDDHVVTPPLPTASTASPQVMQTVGTEPMDASVALTDVAWGTRLDLTCHYDAIPGWDDFDKVRYALWIRTRDGSSEKVASFRALPGRTMHLQGSTAADVQDIASVEIRTASGQPVLRLKS